MNRIKSAKINRKNKQKSKQILSEYFVISFLSKFVISFYHPTKNRKSRLFYVKFLKNIAISCFISKNSKVFRK